MRPALWFCVPVHGRLPLAAICLRQLRITCDALCDHGIDATAVLVADDENFAELKRRLGKKLLGFATITRDNRFLSRRFNDALQFSFDSRYNPRPADYAVPCGSDDWVDYRILLDLPGPNTVLGFQDMTFVREDGAEMVSRHIDTLGGCGIRVYPRQQMIPVGFRPADEDRVRACDTSIITNLVRHATRMKVRHMTIDPRSLVDWKSPDTQLNSYEQLRRHRPLSSHNDPFAELQGFYPQESLDEMEDHYAQALVFA